MADAATANAPGNPASPTSGIAAAAASKIMGGGGGSMTIPPLNFQSSSSSGDIGQSFGFDSSGWSVNVGGANLGTGENAGLWIAAAVVLGVILWRKKST